MLIKLNAGMAVFMVLFVMEVLPSLSSPWGRSSVIDLKLHHLQGLWQLPLCCWAHGCTVNIIGLVINYSHPCEGLTQGREGMCAICLLFHCCGRSRPSWMRSFSHLAAFFFLLELTILPLFLVGLWKHSRDPWGTTKCPIPCSAASLHFLPTHKLTPVKLLSPLTNTSQPYWALACIPKLSKV